MRILVTHPGPHFSVHDVYVGWVEALRDLGVDVIEYNLADRLTFYESALLEVAPGMMRRALNREQAVDLALNGLYSDLYRARPDVLLGISGFFLTPKLLDLARLSHTRVVLVHTESPYEDTRQLQLAGHADLNLVNDPVNIQAFADVAPSLYVPHAYRPNVHHPGARRTDMASDLAFVGTGFASRIQFLDRMDLDGLDVLLAGNWQGLADDSKLRKFVAHNLDECCDNQTAADVYRSARASINIYRREAQTPDLMHGLAMGPREVEMAACGLFFLREPRGEGDQVLPMLPRVTGPEDASEKLRWYLGHDEERQRLAGQARDAIADRTFATNATSLLRLLTR